MTRLEAIGVVLCFGAIGVALAWLGLSAIWGRRRIPPRALPVNQQVTVVTDSGRRELQRRGLRGIYFPPRSTDWLQSDPDAMFRWPHCLPSQRVYDQHNPRQWAHGEA